MVDFQAIEVSGQIRPQQPQVGHFSWPLTGSVDVLDFRAIFRHLQPQRIDQYALIGN